jgi:hypothetical protein
LSVSVATDSPFKCGTIWGSGQFPEITEDELSNLGGEIVLAISTSYTVNSEALANTFDGIPVLNWQLPERNVNSHWSAQKQSRLSAQFRDLLIKLDGLNVRTIHLVLVAQASVVLNFGRQLHRRNMPEVRVYQYEVEKSPPYPWCVRIPKDESTEPEILIL